MIIGSFLKLAGIAGESDDPTHLNEIEVLSYSWGSSQDISPIRTGDGAIGRPAVGELQVVAYMSSASPPLFNAIVSGSKIATAVFSLTTTSPPLGDFVKYEMTEVLIGSLQSQAAEETPMEQFSLNFKTMKFSYRKPSGGVFGPWIFAEWDATASEP